MTIVAALWLLLAIVASVAFAAGFALDASTQIEGASLGVACLSVACALIVWSRNFMPNATAVDEQHPKRSTDDDRDATLDELESGVRQITARKNWLVRLGLAAVSVLGIAALFPIRTFGPNPSGRIGASDWRKGARLVRDDGTPLRADALEIGSVATAFPEGFVGGEKIESMASDAVMVVRVTPHELKLPAARSGWAPAGYLAYSKICTHLGCPLGLYRQGPQQLMCPCHQSIFNVLDGGSVVFGPAARALPQLPLNIDSDGNLRAGGEMSDFIGPDNWDHGA
ncbi:MAG TPA: Rieske 2Fe-2S domain-containing protein [Candidatus Baltobacteraceae bacterium]